jgi:hypothetical protein
MISPLNEEVIKPKVSHLLTMGTFNRFLVLNHTRHQFTCLFFYFYLSYLKFTMVASLLPMQPFNIYQFRRDVY